MAEGEVSALTVMPPPPPRMPETYSDAWIQTAIGELPTQECIAAINAADIRALVTERRDATCMEDAPLLMASAFIEDFYHYLRL